MYTLMGGPRAKNPVRNRNLRAELRKFDYLLDSDRHGRPDFVLSNSRPQPKRFAQAVSQVSRSKSADPELKRIAQNLVRAGKWTDASSLLPFFVMAGSAMAGTIIGLLGAGSPLKGTLTGLGLGIGFTILAIRRAQIDFVNALQELEQKFPIFIRSDIAPRRSSGPLDAGFGREF